jgi:hypothetical protein
MVKVLAFPTKSVRDWAAIDKVVRSILDDSTVDEQAKATILGRLKEFFALCNRSFDITLELALPASSSSQERDMAAESVRTALRSFEEQLHDFFNELLLERLKVEVARYYETLVQ